MIKETDSLFSLVEHAAPGVLLAFDLDNNVFCVEDQFVGTEEWLAELEDYLFLALQDRQRVERAADHFYNAVHQGLSVSPTEPGLAQLFKTFTEKGAMTIGLTARNRSIALETERQLEEIDVTFNTGLEYDRQCFPTMPDVVVHNGVVSCSMSDKGMCLESFLEFTQSRPQSIVMVDDKLSNLQKVERAAIRLDIPFVGYRNGRLDGRFSKLSLQEKRAQLPPLATFFPRVQSGKTEPQMA